MKPTSVLLSTAALVAASIVFASPLAGCSGSSSDGRSSGDSDAEGALGVKHCGGFAGTACSAGYTCVDDPSDSCDPTNGGADCPGVCQ